MNTKLLHMVNEALDLNLEVSATLLNDQLSELFRRVQDEQGKVSGDIEQIQQAIDAHWGSLMDQAVWKNDKRFASTLRALMNACVEHRRFLLHQRRLEVLEDRITLALVGQMNEAGDLSARCGTVIEKVHTRVCDNGGNA